MVHPYIFSTINIKHDTWTLKIFKIFMIANINYIILYLTNLSNEQNIKIII